ncbi:hypothetical protein DXT63_15835 [Thermoanaerobacteraceae bacterium SP2]|nr:hypothetical protein DXT63_15835 [Thermoanaerobacteraceae bacterium SP2]
MKGVLGTTVVKLFDLNVAKTGLFERDVKNEGYDITTVLVPTKDRAHLKILSPNSKWIKRPIDYWEPRSLEKVW